MQESIFINKGSVKGSVTAYPSKSYAQRLLLLGLMSERDLVIENYAGSSDTAAMLDSVVRLGAKVEYKENILKISGTERFKVSEIFCNESGLCLRMLAPVLALTGNEMKIFGTESLLKRGNEYIAGIFSQAGVFCRAEKDHLLIKGPLKSGEMNIVNPAGSQLISGLLYALSAVSGESRICVENPVSAPYVRMTAKLLNQFGADIKFEGEKIIRIKGDRKFSGGTAAIEGDWSSASFFLVAGAIAGEAEVRGLDLKSLQPDREILKYLKKAGALVLEEKASVIVKKADIKCFEADIKNHPDLFIPLVVLAVNCEGESRIYNYERLKFKESDRPSAIINELTKAGAKIKVTGECIAIEKSCINYYESDTYNDHRMAMGLSIAALSSKQGLNIKNPGCVNKSFPLFFEQLRSLNSGDVK
jgi:3-phosphoshikimate 1-carboxyvinyltransferase